MNVRVTGGLNFSGTRIGGDFECSHVTITDVDVAHLYVDGVEIGGDMVLGHGVAINGQVELTRTRIAGSLDCRNAALKGREGGTALWAPACGRSG